MQQQKDDWSPGIAISGGVLGFLIAILLLVLCRIYMGLVWGSIVATGIILIVAFIAYKAVVE